MENELFISLDEYKKEVFKYHCKTDNYNYGVKDGFEMCQNYFSWQKLNKETINSLRERFQKNEKLYILLQTKYGVITFRKIYDSFEVGENLLFYSCFKYID